MESIEYIEDYFEKKLSIDESFPIKMVTDRDNGILRYEKLMVKVS